MPHGDVRPGVSGSVDGAIETPSTGHALERVFASVFEGQPGASHQLFDGLRDQDLRRGSCGTYSRPDRYRDASDLPVDRLDLAGVYPCPDLDAERPHGVDDGTRTVNSARRPVEGREEAVPGGVDLHASIPGDQGPGPHVML